MSIIVVQFVASWMYFMKSFIEEMHIITTAKKLIVLKEVVSLKLFLSIFDCLYSEMMMIKYFFSVRVMLLWFRPFRKHSWQMNEDHHFYNLLI